MNSNIRYIGMNNPWWKGYQLIVLDELPGEIPHSFLQVLLARCQMAFVSLELCVFSSEDQRRLSVGFILRCEDSINHVVAGKLNDLVQSLRPQFEENGFRVHIAEANDPVKTSIDRFFGGDQSPYHMGMGFFPSEKLLGPRHYYLPGKYSAQELSPFSWEQIARILTRYPMSMMCIQLINTMLSPAETTFIQKNRNYFSAIQQDMHAMEARTFYERLLTLVGKPLFFANVFCTGSEPFIRDVQAAMLTWKYASFTLNPQELRKPDYLFFGDGVMKACTVQRGHTPSCIPLFPPQAPFLRLTHLIAPEDAAQLFPLPCQTSYISGLKVKRFWGSPVVIPSGNSYRDNAHMIYIGQQDGTNLPFGMDLEDLRRHGFIVGKSGCGKTTFAMGLLYQLHRQGIPFLVIEPAKCEYRSLFTVISDLKIYTPGLSGVSPIQLNPFLPPKGVSLEEYLPALSTIFNAAISMDHPLDIILPQVIRICYNRYGWRSNSTRDSRGAKHFGMTEFIRCYQEYIRETYADDPESRANLESGGGIRLKQLISEYPLLFDTKNSMDFDEVLTHPAIIELDAIHNSQQRSLIMMIIMVQLHLCIQKRSAMDSRLRNVIMIDEAHLLLGGNGSPREDVLNSSTPFIHYLQDMIMILRSYGTGILFGDQSPEKLTREIMENVNLTIMFSQDSPENRSLLGALTCMDRNMQEDLIGLPPGCGYVFLDKGLTRPIKLQTRDYKKELGLRQVKTNAEIAQMMHVFVEAPFMQCASCVSCANRCSVSLRTDAKFIAERILNSPAISQLLQQEAPPGILSDSLQSDSASIAQQQEQKLRAYFDGGFADDLAACLAEQDIHWPDRGQLKKCVMIQLIRGLLLNGNCCVPEDHLTKLLNPAEEC